MIARRTQLETLMRAVFLGATRPQTPRLQSPPQEADAKGMPPRKTNALLVRMRKNKQRITRKIGQRNHGQYSFNLGGFNFDELPAHISVIVSRLKAYGR